MPKRILDLRGAEVEKWKITPQQRQFLKDMSDLRDIQGLLEKQTMRLQRDAQDVRELWMELEEGFKFLKPPKTPLKEFPEMNFVEEEQTGIAEEGAQGAQGATGQGSHPWVLKY